MNVYDLQNFKYTLETQQQQNYLSGGNQFILYFWINLNKKGTATILIAVFS